MPQQNNDKRNTSKYFSQCINPFITNPDEIVSGSVVQTSGFHKILIEIFQTLVTLYVLKH